MANSMQLSDVLFVVGATGDGRAKDHRKPPAFRSRSVDPKEMYVFFFFFRASYIYIYTEIIYIYNMYSVHICTLYYDVFMYIYMRTVLCTYIYIIL